MTSRHRVQHPPPARRVRRAVNTTEDVAVSMEEENEKDEEDESELGFLLFHPLRCEGRACGGPGRCSNCTQAHVRLTKDLSSRASACKRRASVWLWARKPRTPREALTAHPDHTPTGGSGREAQRVRASGPNF